VATWNAAEAVYNAGGGMDGGVTKAQLISAAQAVADNYVPTSTATLNSYNSTLTATSTIDVSSQATASAALSGLDADIAKVAKVRSTFGAVQNRFDAVVANLQNYSANITASRSRIVDADFASETANLTRGQVLLQAGTAVLAQANAMPQSVLALLR
jgi:flagellin